MDKIDLTKCEKIFDHRIEFPEGAAHMEIYRIPGSGGKDAMFIRYEGIVPEEFKKEITETIKSNKKPSGELYFFSKSDPQ
jgi:hypothetical protein